MKTMKSSVQRVIAFAGLLFLADAIWGLISLHAWIYICMGVAVFYILSYFLKLKK